jgi:hypothetical protein
MNHGRKIWALAAFGISSVVNPGYFTGCASGDEENAPDYKAVTAELVEVVLAANESYDLNMDGVAYRLDVDVEPIREKAEQARRPEPAFAQSAHACGTHKLVATAQACIDSYEMDVTGHVTLLRAADADADADNYEEVARDVAVTGSLEALSSSYATLRLHFNGGRVTLERQNSKTFALDTHDLQALLTD